MVDQWCSILQRLFNKRSQQWVQNKAIIGYFVKISTEELGKKLHYNGLNQLIRILEVIMLYPKTFKQEYYKEEKEKIRALVGGQHGIESRY
jgi:hypothetical protein